MVLTKAELIGSLQHEVNILLHLADKVDARSMDYRPTPKQRSTIDWLGSQKGKPNAHVIGHIDAVGFYERLTQSLAKL